MYSYSKYIGLDNVPIHIHRYSRVLRIYYMGTWTLTVSPSGVCTLEFRVCGYFTRGIEHGAVIHDGIDVFASGPMLARKAFHSFTLKHKRKNRGLKLGAQLPILFVFFCFVFFGGRGGSLLQL